MAHTLSEGDGYFDIIGLAPGKYTARIDESQLAKLNMQVTAPLPFTIRQNTEGDIISDLKLTVQVVR